MLLFDEIFFETAKEMECLNKLVDRVQTLFPDRFSIEMHALDENGGS